MAAFKVVSEWYPAKERALVHGVIQGGAAIGAIIAPPVITWINARHGWQPAFLVTGSLGFVWLALWLALYHPPESHPQITIEEREYVLAEAAQTPVLHKISAQQILSYSQTWGLLLGRFFSDPVWWFYLFWLPKYLVEQRGFTMVEMGMLAWLPYLSADLGAIFGGWMSGRLLAAGRSPIAARMAVMIPCALMMPLSFAIHHAPSRTLTIALICAVTFSHMVWKTNQNTLTNDVFPKQMVGTASGILAFGTGLGGTLFTWMTGFVVQRFGYSSIFMVMGVLHPLSYLIIRRMVTRPVSP
jgi:ACS family hexuronate transporter-like MFS transporter